jgi:hypothetical protein
MIIHKLEVIEQPVLALRFTPAEVKILRCIFNHFVFDTNSASDKILFACLTNEQRVFVNNMHRAVTMPGLLVE